MPHFQRLSSPTPLRTALVQPDETTIAALWAKSVRSFGSSTAEGIDVDTAIDAAYKALLQSAMALLESGGYRISGTTTHHRDTFYAAAGLGDWQLEKLDIETEFVRVLRSRSVYQPVEGNADDLARVHRLARRVLPAVRSAIAARWPGLGPEMPGLSD